MFAGLSNAKDSAPRNRPRSIPRRASSSRLFSFRPNMFVSLLSMVLLLSALGCRSDSGSQGVRPRQLRDVPARRLAFTFQADLQPPAAVATEEAKTIIPAFQQDFDARRQDDALLRTVPSPDGQRALALYGTADEPTQTFRIDLYSADGKFLRNLTPPDLAVVFQDSVVWSADGGLIAFVGRRNSKPTPSPTPIDEVEPAVPNASPQPSPSIAPLFAPLA